MILLLQLIASSTLAGSIVWYFTKRYVEGKPVTEKLEEFSKLADLQKKLSDEGVSVDDLRKLRRHVLSREAETVASAAIQLTNQAQHIIADAESTFLERKVAPLGDLHDDAVITQADMNEAAWRAAGDRDEELSKIVNDMASLLEPEDRNLFLLVHSKWQEFRAAEVEREAHLWKGGSISPVMTAAKFETLTLQRTASLVANSRTEGLTESDGFLSSPGDLFDLVELHTHKSHVLNVLGSPTYVRDGSWIFLYRECQFQIQFDQDDAVETQFVAVCEGMKISLPSTNVDIPLGVMTIADVLNFDSNSTLSHSQSMRTEELTLSTRIGPPGVWEEFTFGALKLGIPVGRLLDVEFEWDSRLEQLRGFPSDTRINWIGRGSNATIANFDWYIR